MSFACLFATVVLGENGGIRRLERISASEDRVEAGTLRSYVSVSAAFHRTAKRL